MKMSTTFKGLITVILIGFASIGQAQIFTNYSLGDGIKVEAKDSSFSTTIFGRFQSNFSSEAPVPDFKFQWSDFESDFTTRRVRLGLKGHLYDPAVTYRLELGFGNEDHPSINNLLDAWIAWKFARGFEVRFGQGRLAGNRERMTYSQNLQFVSRSTFNDKFNLDRDLGMQLTHTITLGNVVLKETLSASQGDGLGDRQFNQGGYDYLARVDVLPLGEFTNNGDQYYADLEREQSPKLAIGMAYDFHDNAHRSMGTRGNLMAAERDLHTFFGDLLFKYKGFSLAAEYGHREVKVADIYNKEFGYYLGSFYSGWGMNTQVGYLINSNWEFAGRFTYVNPDRDVFAPALREYSLGINKYISGNWLKVQGNGTYQNYDNSDPVLLFNLQVEAGF